MRLVEITEHTRDKLVIVCTCAFLLMAVFTALSDIFDIPDLVASLVLISPQWMHPALDAFFILMVGVFATYLVSRLTLERTKMEEEVQLRAQLLNAATDSIFLYRSDGSFVYINEAAYKLLGYSKEQLMAMNRRNIVAPEFTELFDSRVKKSWTKGKPSSKVFI